MQTVHAATLAGSEPSGRHSDLVVPDENVQLCEVFLERSASAGEDAYLAPFLAQRATSCSHESRLY